MIEAAMYVALGFCTAGLIGLAILPAFYRRAARLTEEALRAVNPASYAEVRAAQDQERARYAVELTRVETRLDREREKAAGFHLEASRLRTEIEALQKSHQDELAELTAKLSAQDSETHAVDMLSAEIKTLKEKLAEAEKALAESWTSAPEAKAAKDDAAPDETGEQAQPQDNDWLPATDTMALATITALEAEVATLKAKLAKYEPTVASEVEATLQDASKSRLAGLEAQLVDTESKYVSAQAEVTRLSLMLETAGVADAKPDARLEAQLKELTAEISAQQTAISDKERQLHKLRGQNRKLRDDLAAAPELRHLRQEFKDLSDKISTAEQISVKRVTKRVVAKKKKPQEPAAATPPAQEAPKTPETKATETKPRKATASRPKTRQRIRQSAAAAPPPETTSKPPAAPPAPSPAKSADIASAAEALVSRIVASSRNNARNNPDGETAPGGAEPAAKRKPEAARKTKSASQKKQDVA